VIVNQTKRQRIRVTAERRDVEYAPYIIIMSNTPKWYNKEIEKNVENYQHYERTSNTSKFYLIVSKKWSNRKVAVNLFWADGFQPNLLSTNFITIYVGPRLRTSFKVFEFAWPLLKAMIVNP